MARVSQALNKFRNEQTDKGQGERPLTGDVPDNSNHPGRLPVAEPGSVRYFPALVAHHDRGGRICEQYRTLRTNILAKYPDERFSIIVTSAEAGEGKTVTCLNIAMVLAELPERRTVVLDCDMRKSRIATMLRAENSPGMADLLRGSSTLRGVIQSTAYPNLFLVPAGQARQSEVGELMGRPELDEIIGQLRSLYDYVLFDTPPINSTSDAGMLGQAAGEALLVVRMNKTPQESVDRAIRLLHAANIKIAGICLSHQEYQVPGYLYQYT